MYRYVIPITMLYLAFSTAGLVKAQTADTLLLDEVRVLATQRDPRALQPALIEAASRLQLENIRAQFLPQVALTGQFTYQNEVPSFPAGPGDLEGPPLDQYRVQAEVDWLLYGGGRMKKEAAVEQARLNENLYRVEHSLHGLRTSATETFFAALLFQSQENTLALAVEDVEGRLALINTRVQEGAALPSDAAALDVELIRLRQQQMEGIDNKRGALKVLSELLDTNIPESTRLEIPEITGAFDSLLSVVKSDDKALMTPELALLASRQQRLYAESRLASVGTLPQVSLFGQAGYGRPGPFNFLSQDLNEYGLVGIRFRWSIWDWGQSRRQTRSLQQQALITQQDYRASRRQIIREAQDEQIDIHRLEEMLTEDQRAILLRTQILDVARQQLEEGTMLPADYVDRVTDLAEARLTRDLHYLELSRAQVRLLSSLGLYPERPIELPSTFETH